MLDHSIPTEAAAAVPVFGTPRHPLGADDPPLWL